MSDGIYLRKPSVYIDDIPVFSSTDHYIKNYERIAKDHLASMDDGDGNPNIEEDLWLQLEESTRHLIRTHSSPGDVVLDAGVGLGRVLGPFTELNRHGIDISPDYLRHAKKHGFSVALSKLEDLPYVDDLFDLVVACDVLEHVIDLNACCAQLIRVLKPGGTLIVRVPYLDDLEAYLDESLPYEFIHLRSFDLAGLRLLFSKIFNLEFLEHRFVAPFLKGHPRMRLKLLHDSGSLKARLAAIDDTEHPLHWLKFAAEKSAEEMINWIYALRDKNPSDFAEIAEELVLPLEVNVVFRKPT